ncbi:MAG TPA: LysR family transcriptional regulator [Polyangiales bacterium]|jgi:DNA-binding transcriptional LysR family regulator
MDLLDKMATYVRVIEAGSFSAAAKQLRISPAAVSRQIASLERELRASLIARSTRRMAVTALGRRYYEQCLRILREVDDAQAIGRGASVEGLLAVSAPMTFGLACVAPHMRALMQKHPSLRVDLILEDRLVDLALEGIDVAIRVGGVLSDSGELIAKPLGSFPRVLVAAPDYVRRKGEPKTPESLAKHAALTFSTGALSEQWVLSNDEREARVRLHAVFRSNALDALRQLALAGAGIALLPEWLVDRDLAQRSLRRVLSDWRIAPPTVYAIHRTAQRGAPRVRAFIDHLFATYAQSSRLGI